MTKQFGSTDTYVASEDLLVAVNAAVALERPLLVKGEPGTGKTELAREVARCLEMPLISWHVKSTTKAQQGLYEYDAVARLRDSQLGEASVHDIKNYIRKGSLWEAFESESSAVLLIDEIDKADVEFPNDLLLELDRMEFFVYETRETVKASKRPVVIITSNDEKELPDAFLRRCFFHYIAFPERETMIEIIDRHYPGLETRLLEEALETFYGLRQIQGMRKRPSTSELLDWIRVLSMEEGVVERLEKARGASNAPPLVGALLKNERDIEIVSRGRRRG